MSSKNDITFLCDEMLGRLARDLRLLGYDAAYASGVGDQAILALARAEGRLLLTKDKALATTAGRDALLLRSNDELREVVEALRLRPDRAAFLSRCAECGARLEPAAGERAAHGAQVHRCPRCGKAYWEGSHVASIRARLGRFLPGGEASGEG